jgi:hypothetical protein
MLLATTALLLQFVAAPGIALPAMTETTNSNATAVAPEKSEATSLVAAAEPDANVTYMPGRLTLEPVTPAAAEPAALTPTPVISSSAAIEKDRRWQRRQKQIWMGLAIAQSSAAMFDAGSTRQVISSGAGYELNPMLRPFAGNGSLYAAIQVAPLVLDYVGHRMLMSHHRWARDTWWIPQAVGTVVSVAGGVNNVGVLNAR